MVAFKIVGRVVVKRPLYTSTWMVVRTTSSKTSCMVRVTVVPLSPFFGLPASTRVVLSKMSQEPLSPIFAVMELTFLLSMAFPSRFTELRGKVHEKFPPTVVLT